MLALAHLLYVKTVISDFPTTSNLQALCFTCSIVKEESSSPISGATVSGSAGSTAENITVAAVDAASGGAQGLHLLSQSVPTNWGGGSQPQLIQQQHLHQQQHQQPPAGFNTSVDQVSG